MINSTKKKSFHCNHFLSAGKRNRWDNFFIICVAMNLHFTFLKLKNTKKMILYMIWQDYNCVDFTFKQTRIVILHNALPLIQLPEILTYPWQHTEIFSILYVVTVFGHDLPNKMNIQMTALQERRFCFSNCLSNA